MERGKFIALEGIDGSGKSTQIGRLVERLTRRGVSCHATREPTVRSVGALIRQALTGQTPLDPPGHRGAVRRRPDRPSGE